MRHVADAHSISEPVFFILASLAKEPHHGYSLLKDIEAISGGRVRLSTGTLYGALRRLLENGWIERFETEDTSRDKQAYRLTNEGRKQLRAELERMKQLTQKASARLRARAIYLKMRTHLALACAMILAAATLWAQPPSGGGRGAGRCPRAARSR